ncbi:hypothetical protein U370_02235 [Anaplasma marginale str. Dawn]|nr:hypothetical protein U370_02235 [Anaplasma marginale str. Dawn]
MLVPSGAGFLGLGLMLRGPCAALCCSLVRVFCRFVDSFAGNST